MIQFGEPNGEFKKNYPLCSIMFKWLHDTIDIELLDLLSDTIDIELHDLLSNTIDIELHDLLSDTIDIELQDLLSDTKDIELYLLNYGIFIDNGIWFEVDINDVQKWKLYIIYVIYDLDLILRTFGDTYWRPPNSTPIFHVCFFISVPCLSELL